MFFLADAATYLKQSILLTDALQISKLYFSHTKLLAMWTVERRRMQYRISQSNKEQALKAQFSVPVSLNTFKAGRLSVLGKNFVGLLLPSPHLTSHVNFFSNFQCKFIFHSFGNITQHFFRYVKKSFRKRFCNQFKIFFEKTSFGNVWGKAGFKTLVDLYGVVRLEVVLGQLGQVNCCGVVGFESVVFLQYIRKLFTSQTFCCWKSETHKFKKYLK